MVDTDENTVEEQEEEETITRMLPVPLTEQEKSQLADSFAALQKEKEKAEADKKAIDKEYSDDIKGYEAQISQLAKKLNEGTQQVETECYWSTDDPEPGMKQLYRVDTAEKVDEPVSMTLFDSENEFPENPEGDENVPSGGEPETEEK